MNDMTRKSLPLVGVLALTSSALFVGAGSAMAAKEPPSATAYSPHCESILGDADYDINIYFGANKGRWVFVSVDVETLAGRIIPTNHSEVTRHDMRRWLPVEATDAGNPPEPAEAVVTVWSRKDVALREQRFIVCP